MKPACYTRKLQEAKALIARYDAAGRPLDAAAAANVGSLRRQVRRMEWEAKHGR